MPPCDEQFGVTVLAVLSAVCAFSALCTAFSAACQDDPAEGAAAAKRAAAGVLGAFAFLFAVVPAMHALPACCRFFSSEPTYDDDSDDDSAERQPLRQSRVV